MFVLERCPSYRESNKGSKRKAGTNYRCPFYRGVRLIEVSVKRELTVTHKTRTFSTLFISYKMHVLDSSFI